jgi:hypothetical protein
MTRLDARTLAAALATIALSAYAAKAENYMLHFVPPCYTCNTIPKPKLPDLFGQTPKFEAPGQRPAEHARMRPQTPGTTGRRRP